MNKRKRLMYPTGSATLPVTGIAAKQHAADGENRYEVVWTSAKRKLDKVDGRGGGYA